jgi:hypothetical protein
LAVCYDSEEAGELARLDALVIKVISL